MSQAVQSRRNAIVVERVKTGQGRTIHQPVNVKRRGSAIKRVRIVGLPFEMGVTRGASRGPADDYWMIKSELHWRIER